MSDLGKQIIKRATALGASMAGIADLEPLKTAPSSQLLKKVGTKADGVYWKPEEEGFIEIRWPEKAEAALIIAVYHPEETPDLDHWSNSKGGTQGNRVLMDINRKLSSWIKESFDIRTHRMPYGIESGGIYLKDAAVLAGLGCIGRNNMLVTPAFGPRIRLRALLIEAELIPTGSIDFDPCNGCDEYCRKACPQDAFVTQVHDADSIGISDLPGRDGGYSRAKCKLQMDRDVAAAADSVRNWKSTSGNAADDDSSGKHVRYCRRCEFACPIGHRKESDKSSG